MKTSNITKTIHHKALILLTVLSFFVPVSHIEANQCVDVFEGNTVAQVTEVAEFPAWSPENLDPLKTLKADHFFPQNFLDEVKSHKKSLHLALTRADNAKGLIGFRFKDNKGTLIAHFDLWEGTAQDHIIVENLGAENPIPTVRSDQLRQSQSAKGLPPKVFFHVRNQLFKLLKAGGYKHLEVTTSQDILVYFLYNKLIGAKPANELSQKMNEFLSYIVEDTIKGKLPPFSASSTTDFSKYLGDYFTDPVPEEVISTWKKYQNTPVLLEDAGIEAIHDQSGHVIGIKWDSKKVAFVIPFLPDKPVLTWKNIHENYPHIVKMIKDLPQ